MPARRCAADLDEVESSFSALGIGVIPVDGALAVAALEGCRVVPLPAAG